jgi:hypothetical protein
MMNLEQSTSRCGANGEGVLQKERQNHESLTNDSSECCRFHQLGRHAREGLGAVHMIDILNQWAPLLIRKPVSAC